MKKNLFQPLFIEVKQLSVKEVAIMFFTFSVKILMVNPPLVLLQSRQVNLQYTKQ